MAVRMDFFSATPTTVDLSRDPVQASGFRTATTLYEKRFSGPLVSSVVLETADG